MVTTNARARRIGVALLATAVLAAAGVAEARITIRPRRPLDSFFFHAAFARVPFDPTQSFGLEIWNCPSGAMPAFIADVVARIVCDVHNPAGPTPAVRAYAVELPAGQCEDHGASCDYRSGNVNGRAPGIQFLRITYARRRLLNRVWLQSYDDLSAVDRANMLLLLTVDGAPRALLQDEFTPLARGGWFSHY